MALGVCTNRELLAQKYCTNHAGCEAALASSEATLGLVLRCVVCVIAAGLEFSWKSGRQGVGQTTGGGAGSQT